MVAEFVSPTKTRGAARFDDVWALSATLFYAVSGAPPFPSGVRWGRATGRREAPAVAVFGTELWALQTYFDAALSRSSSALSTERVLAHFHKLAPRLRDLPRLPIASPVIVPPHDLPSLVAC